MMIKSLVMALHINLLSVTVSIKQNSPERGFFITGDSACLDQLALSCVYGLRSSITKVEKKPLSGLLGNEGRYSPS